MSLLRGSVSGQSAPPDRPVDVALILGSSRLPEQAIAAVEFLLGAGEVAARPLAKLSGLANGGRGAHQERILTHPTRVVTDQCAVIHLQHTAARRLGWVQTLTP